MNGIMAKLRSEGLKILGGKKVIKIRDIQTGISYNPESPDEKTTLDFPKSNVLQFFLEGGTIVSARPSGTEPKIKFYINSKTPLEGNCDKCLARAKEASASLCDSITSEINSILDAATK